MAAAGTLKSYTTWVCDAGSPQMWLGHTLGNPILHLQRPLETCGTREALPSDGNQRRPNNRCSAWKKRKCASHLLSASMVMKPAATGLWCHSRCYCLTAGVRRCAPLGHGWRATAAGAVIVVQGRSGFAPVAVHQWQLPSGERAVRWRCPKCAGPAPAAGRCVPGRKASLHETEARTLVGRVR